MNRGYSRVAMSKHKVVIAGGGFAGLAAARALRRAPVDITLVDKNNYHLFQPLLYQVATGGLSPANIAAPLRHVFRRQPNVNVRLGEVKGIDVEGRRVKLLDDAITYNTLIMAVGSETSYFGKDAWALRAQGLKSVEDATEMRAQILSAFERAEFEPDPDARQALLTFVIVGGGPTGVELAGALAEIARYTLTNEFRSIEPSDARIVLVEQNDRVLPPYPAELSRKAAGYLRDLNVELQTGATILDIDNDGVTLQTPDRNERIQARTVLWAAGIKASRLADQLARDSGAEQDRIGRIAVGPDLALSKHPEIFIIGDLASVGISDGTVLPAIAPVAAQAGRYVGISIKRRLSGQLMPPFHYRDYGMMATVGRRLAVARIGGVCLPGHLAWVFWLFVHLMKLVLFEARLLVFVQWGWSYLTWNKTARLITRIPQ
ncbi:MAG: NAD(P)/FAD-dependent oxidoreductase [Candidatus Hydrogenedentes bacterium]|nr:NAD(P)/FAD-dependent oxidoreductase [Candidatus Hydrogenedentota bacterium]